MTGAPAAARARAIALYLPQFHPIPENDSWWGRGFTEWTNTAKARPLFRGHDQPHIPADLGFYDLRVPETRQAQADLAASHGIEAFCYYHYWFAGRRILERPFAEVLASGAPTFPFCLCWANESWTGVWHGEPRRMLVEQTYPGMDDHAAHFDALLPAFADPRHVRVDGKPLFLIYKPEAIPNAAAVLEFWRARAAQAGLGGLYLVGMAYGPSWSPLGQGFDAKVLAPLLVRRPWVSRRRPLAWLTHKARAWRGMPTIQPYDSLTRGQMPPADLPYEAYPCLIHAWDNTPRSGGNGVVLSGTSPARFRLVLEEALASVAAKPADRRLIFLKSWNEWAEGNHLEPDLADGLGYLREVAGALAKAPLG